MQEYKCLRINYNNFTDKILSTHQSVQINYVEHRKKTNTYQISIAKWQLLWLQCKVLHVYFATTCCVSGGLLWFGTDQKWLQVPLIDPGDCPVGHLFPGAAQHYLALHQLPQQSAPSHCWDQW